MTTTRAPMSPVRPEFTRLDTLMWTAHATRFSTTSRGRQVLLADQGVGHQADMKRLQEHLGAMTATDLSDYLEYHRIMEAQKR